MAEATRLLLEKKCLFFSVTDQYENIENNIAASMSMAPLAAIAVVCLVLLLPVTATATLVCTVHINIDSLGMNMAIDANDVGAGLMRRLRRARGRGLVRDVVGSLFE